MTYDIEGNPPAPATLFHYCSAQTVRAILTTNTIWASDVLSTNDPDEITYGHRLAQSIVRERDANGGDKYLISDIPDIGLVRDVMAGWCTHVACFSTDPTLESQWDRYAQSGTGYALGFDRPRLDRYCRPKVIALFPMLYDRADQDRVIRAFLDRIRERAPNRRWSDAPVEALRSFTNQYMFALLMRFKDSDWEREHEWRIQVVQTPDRIQFQPFEADGRCRFALPLCVPGTLTDIWIGPANETPDADVTTLLRTSGFDRVRLHRANRSMLTDTPQRPS